MRKLEKACLFDNRFRVLSGEQLPGRRTLDHFFHRHAKAINALFSQVVALARQMGLANLAQLDSLRESLRSSNAEERGDDCRVEEEIVRRQERLEKIQAAKAALEAQARARNEDAPRLKAQKSFNDHDALPIFSKGKEFLYGYNAQAAVDPESQVVIAETLHNSCADSKALPEILQEIIKETGGESPEHVLADAGYASGENMATSESQGAVPIVACGKGEREGDRRVDEDLTHVPEKDCYRCPKGKLIPQQSIEKDGSRTIDVPDGFPLGEVAS